MNLREPKKKHKARLQPKPPLPITIGKNEEWVVYTAHLTDFGSCIVDPNEIIAIHSMGFFGKGSLSRGYPSFGKARYGTPPVVRNRQWLCRQQWLSEVKTFSDDTNKDIDPNNENSGNNSENIETSECDKADKTNNSACSTTPAQEEVLPSEVDTKSQHTESDKTPEIIEVNMLPPDEPKVINVNDANKDEVDEITLDSAEEDDMCMIINNNFNNQGKTNEEITNIEAMAIYCDINDTKNKSPSISDENIQAKLLVLPDSDSEVDDYLKDVKPRIENEGFPISETLHLTAEETFFLLFGLGCLQVINIDGSFLDINSVWEYFCKQKHFIQKYVVYHYFRSKGWVVKPGLKYGGDFLLYKNGPPFYHASYIVIIDVIDADTLIRDTGKSTRQLTWSNLFGLERLSETAAKEILFAQVLWPSTVPRESNPLSPDILSEFTVRELLWRRWIPKQTRDVLNLEEDDEDSY